MNLFDKNTHLFVIHSAAGGFPSKIKRGTLFIGTATVSTKQFFDPINDLCFALVI